MNLARTRLEQQRLVGPRSTSPEAVVRELLAVQSQDFPGAKWAISLRCEDADDAVVHEAFQDGRILRTHVLRPTWHFVTPEDLRWLLELTSSRVHALNAYYYRQHGIDATLARKSNTSIAKALSKGEHLTRDELGATLKATGNRLAYFIMRAELDALIVSGRMRGKQHTYALVEERAPQSRKLGRDEALAELALRFVKGHGPAQAQDLAWWSGLSVADSSRGLEASGLEQERLDGKTFWFSAARPVAKSKTPIVHLLPNYDELLVAFKDRSAMVDARVKTKKSVLFAHAVVIDGLVVGAWRREIGAKQVRVSVEPLRAISAPERSAIQAAAELFAQSLGVQLEFKLTT